MSLGLIAAAVGLTYANSLRGGFVLDDVGSIVENSSIRQLWPPSSVLSPPRGLGDTAEGRPILNLSFALNFASSGTSPRGYHLTNIAIHLLASLVLFGLVRRTIGRRAIPNQTDATGIALIAALWWGLHPIQTESVTYVVQRAESLMGLFFLTALYGIVRAAESAENSWRWSLLSVTAAWLCAGTKEVAVTLPVVALLYDRTFLAGSFADTWRLRRRLHLGLAASWIIVIGLAIYAGDRGGTIGAKAGISHWEYALCQARGLYHYFYLGVWPHPLIFDYGTNFVSFAAALPWALGLLVVLAATVFGVMKFPAAGFLGACFFIILAPTSSFVGGTRQMLAEHRMYLSLAALAVGAAVLGYRVLGRRALILGLIATVPLAIASAARNAVYREGLSLWQDTVLKRPENPWAHFDFANFLADQPGRRDEAYAHYQTALRLKPDFFLGHNNLALLLAAQSGRESEAVVHYETALRLKPDYAVTHYDLALLLARYPESRRQAIAHYEIAAQLKPEFAEAHFNLALMLASDSERASDALTHFEIAARLRPNLAAVQFRLAAQLEKTPGRLQDAKEHYLTALKLDSELQPAKEALQRLENRGH